MPEQKFKGGLAIGIREEDQLFVWSMEIPKSGLTFVEIAERLSQRIGHRPDRVLVVKNDRVVYDENVKEEEEP